MVDPKALSDALAWAMVMTFVIGIAVGVALWEGIPWIWELVKPWLHRVTG